MRVASKKIVDLSKKYIYNKGAYKYWVFSFEKCMNNVYKPKVVKKSSIFATFFLFYCEILFKVSSCIFNEIRQLPVAQIYWRSIIAIMSKCKNHSERLWYVSMCHKNGWGRDMLLNQIAMKAYERSLIEPTTTNVVNASSDDLIKELFKDTYVFDFLDREKIKTEKDLKDEMINNIIKFLHELGPGFSLVGKEYKLTTPTNEEFYIDLLMYHTKIHAYVVIEVKIGKFHPVDFGQLVFYVNAIDRLERTERDEPTFGLLLCKDADTFVAETTLTNSSSYVGIAKYKFIEELPQYLKNRLNGK